MSILSGYIKQKKYKKLNDGYKLVSEDTQSTTVYMASGITLEEALDGKRIRVLPESAYNALSSAEKTDKSVIYLYY